MELWTHQPVSECVRFKPVAINTTRRIDESCCYIINKAELITNQWTLKAFNPALLFLMAAQISQAFLQCHSLLKAQSFHSIGRYWVVSAERTLPLAERSKSVSSGTGWLAEWEVFELVLKQLPRLDCATKVIRALFFSPPVHILYCSISMSFCFIS